MPFCQAAIPLHAATGELFIMLYAFYTVLNRS